MIEPVISTLNSNVGLVAGKKFTTVLCYVVLTVAARLREARNTVGTSVVGKKEEGNREFLERGNSKERILKGCHQRGRSD
jgi:hypothetical protein